MLRHRPLGSHRPRRASHRIAAGLLAVLAVGLPAACSPRSAVPATTLTPLVAPDQLPTSSVAPSTTAAPSSDPSKPLLVAPPEGECAYSDPLPGGEVTFELAERLYAVAPDGTLAHCISTLNGSDRGVVRWSPRADRALLNNATVFDADGRRANGFVPENVRVRFVQPAGDALIGPTATNRTLVRRDAVTAARSEITFLIATEVALSHPGGGQIIASGQDVEGTRGIFVANDTGGNVRQLLRVDDDATTISELGADADGTTLWFITAGDTSFGLERLTFPDLTLSDVTSEQAPLSDLVTGPVTATTAWKVGLCNSVTDVQVLDPQSAEPVDVGEGTPIESLSLAPIGWLDANRLVVAARPLGCDGPADVWIWNRSDNSATLLVLGVEFPAVRIQAQRAAALSISPTAEMPVL